MGRGCMNYRPTVLLAHDDKSFVLSVSTLLDRMSFDVIPVEDSESVFTYAKKFNPDIIVIDENLPSIGGFETAHLIKQETDTSFIPVILLTESPNKERVYGFKKTNSARFLKKPIHLLDFNRTLYECIKFPGSKIKRKHLRAKFTGNVALHYKGATTHYHAVTLSEGGVFLRDASPLSPGKRVFVDLPLHNDNALEINGSVIYTRKLYGGIFNIGPGMAIAFKELTQDDSEHIRDYVVSQLMDDLPHARHIISSCSFA
jgi:CheY-like chemotaxis protein